MALDPINIGAILVVLITVIGGWITQRTAVKSNQLTAKENAEIEAYNRARTMDLQTIKRQDEEIEELNQTVIALRNRVIEKNKRLAIQEEELEKQQIIIRALRRNMGIPEQRSEENHE